MLRKLDKFLSYIQSVNDLILFLQILVFITIVPVLLRVLSLENLMKVLTHKSHGGNVLKSAVQISKTIKFVDMILNRNFWIYKNVCIKRALTLYYFLRKQRFEVQICYGVKKENYTTSTNNLGAHAWLIHNGNVFAEPGNVSMNEFATMYVYPS